MSFWSKGYYQGLHNHSIIPNPTHHTCNVIIFMTVFYAFTIVHRYDFLHRRGYFDESKHKPVTAEDVQHRNEHFLYDD